MTAQHAQRTEHTTIASALENYAVPFSELRRTSRSLLVVAETVIGEPAEAFRFMAIHRPVLDAYRRLMDRLLHMPAPMRRRDQLRHLVGLAMWGSSWAGGSTYCVQHSCSVALHWGADAAKLADPTKSQFDPAEAAVVAAAMALGTNPPTLDAEQWYALRSRLPRRQLERTVGSVWLMGWLNEANDTIGVPIEAGVGGVARTVMDAAGWVPRDSLPPVVGGTATFLRLLPFGARERVRNLWLTRRVPRTRWSLRRWLDRRTGHDFAVLGRIRDRQTRRVIASVIRDATDPYLAALDVRVKVFAGQVWAHTTDDPWLKSVTEELAVRTGPAPDGPATRAAISLARRDLAGSGNPLTATGIADVCQVLTARQVIDLIAFLAWLRLMGRVYAWYAAEDAATAAA